jgi:hypothetical protein
MAKLPWKPWHEVVKLRDDLRSGELPMHMFAADLYEVMMQRGKRPIYEKPEHFFALTFPTYNLRHLVRDVVLRLAGKNDKAVRQLELTYGGGKTHTLITLRHLVNDPKNLPDLPAVAEFVGEIGQKPPQCRIAGLCFDKLDVEKGMEVCSPDGKTRTLRHPWSVLAYQLAGDAGLKVLHASNKAEERETAPAENVLIELLELPGKDGLGTLILIDEVLMYAREKIRMDFKWEDSIVNFFQYLTQAVVKVDRCCIVASLLATDPSKLDDAGKRILGKCREVFNRQQEELVQPVEKQDVAEVLRRRFFTHESLKTDFRPHVIYAMKGITALDEQTRKQGVSAEDRFVQSYPFHPDLTEVLYEKWTDLPSFQKTRGVLRTFALALRDAVAWDQSPLVGPQIFLNTPGVAALSASARELVLAANSQNQVGQGTAWGPLLEGEITRAAQIQNESVGLKFREIEQAVVATFLHSQPVGQTARARDLLVLLGATQTDKIELEKGLARWSQSSYWLDDLYTAVYEGQLPGTWRLGNRPNLTQMHAVAAKNIPDDTVRARLLDDIGKAKALTANASAAGVRVHTLPTRPKDIEDDGAFHYAVLGPNAASESGKPSAEAKRFLDETTGSDRPRVYRNAVLLVTPSKDGMELAMARVRDYLAWEVVRDEVKKQQKDGNVDPARAQTMQINIDKAKGRMPEAIKQAYSIVVTVSEKDEAQAFKITVTEEPHFNTIKSDKRSRVQDTTITAEALLPDGPYNLWREGETARRVKDLAGAFAQLPHLPKMLKASAILDTLVEGCEQGTFVLRLTRPDGTSRTWWMSRPDENALNDPAMELVLPEAAVLTDIAPALLAPKKLPGLWTANEIAVKAAFDYFDGKTVVQVNRDGYQDPMQIPKAEQDVVEVAITAAVVDASVWLLSGPASILGEPIPAGILNASGKLCVPPAVIAAAEILPENLKDAWKNGMASGLSIATVLSVKVGKTLPWKTVRDVIGGALQARFMELDAGSQAWPCDFPSAQFVLLRATECRGRMDAGGGTMSSAVISKMLVAVADLEPSQIQDLGDIVPKLLEVKTKTKTPIRFQIRIEMGDGKTMPSAEATQKANAILKSVKEGLHLQ